MTDQERQHEIGKYDPSQALQLAEQVKETQQRLVEVQTELLAVKNFNHAILDRFLDVQNGLIALTSKAKQAFDELQAMIQQEEGTTIEESTALPGDEPSTPELGED